MYGFQFDIIRLMLKGLLTIQYKLINIINTQEKCLKLKMMHADGLVVDILSYYLSIIIGPKYQIL